MTENGITMTEEEKLEQRKKIQSFLTKYVIETESSNNILTNLKANADLGIKVIQELANVCWSTINVNKSLGESFVSLIDAVNDILAIKEHLNYDEYSIFFDKLEQALEGHNYDKSDEDNEIQSDE